MRSSNPALTDNTFSQYTTIDITERMTVQGVVMKTLLLLLLLMLSAGWTWSVFYKAHGDVSSVQLYMIGGALAGLVIALVTAFKQTWAPVTAPLYALAEGLLVGGLSVLLETKFPGIAIQAAGLTLGTLAAMLFCYQAGLIRATENFKLGVMAATGGIAIFYLISIGLSFFGIQMSIITGNGWMGIAFSVFVVAIAALNFVIDFDFIEQGAQRGAPKYMEWYGAFALMVAVIWLYIAFLRLLSKFRSR